MIISLFSVVIPIQSREIIYNYDNFGDIFPQGDCGNNYQVNRYANIDKIFDTEYKGTNIGGAYLLQGSSYITTPEFKGQVVNITATFYCGSTYAVEAQNTLWILISWPEDTGAVYLCQEGGWQKYTWIPSSSAKFQKFHLVIGALGATINKAYGFDELRITTLD